MEKERYQFIALEENFFIVAHENDVHSEIKEFYIKKGIVFISETMSSKELLQNLKKGYIPPGIRESIHFQKINIYECLGSIKIDSITYEHLLTLPKFKIEKKENSTSKSKYIILIGLLILLGVFIYFIS